MEGSGENVRKRKDGRWGGPLRGDLDVQNTLVSVDAHQAEVPG